LSEAFQIQLIISPKVQKKCGSARNGSFDFAEAFALCVRAKANVPFVGRQKNFKIFVRWGICLL